VGTARRFLAVGVGVASAPGFGDKFDRGLGIAFTQTGDKLFLPAFIGDWY
jgi:hypothetical protein